jgi:hypothetical protein
MTALLTAKSFPGVPDAMAGLTVQSAVAAYWSTPWYLTIVGGLERVFAITLQIAMALLVVRSVARQQIGYLLAAIALHTAVDAWAVYASQTWGIAVTEAGLAVMAAFGLWLILRLREEPAPAEAALPPMPALTAAELAPHALSDAELAHRAADSRYE